MKKTLAVDIDGVIADFHKGFRKWLMENMAEEILAVPPSVAPCWSYVEMGVFETNGQFLDAYNAAIKDKLFESIEPIPGAVDALGKLAEEVELFLLTARPDTGGTQEWLWSHGVSQEIPVEFRDGKVNHPRARELLFVDDSPSELKGFSDARAAFVVIDQPYNRGIVGPRAISLAKLPEILPSLL